MSPKSTILLVHGAFADGSSWQKVIAILQSKGFDVIAVQNPTTSLADDVAVVRRTLETLDHPVVLAGHSWGGMVITEAGLDDKISALVYVSAFAPAVGESVNDLFAGLPQPEWFASVAADSAGNLRLSPEGIAKYFSQDLDAAESAVVAAVQTPFPAAANSEKVTVAAWEKKPSHYVVSAADRIIDPELQRSMAAKIGAVVTEVDGGHAAILSRPDEVAAAIAAAALHARAA